MRPENKKKMSENDPSSEKEFLADLVEHATPTTVYLGHGVRLEGVITWLDDCAIGLSRGGHTQMIYKHAIATVMRKRPSQY